MQRKDWEIIAVGDRLKRATFTRVEAAKHPTPEDFQTGRAVKCRDGFAVVNDIHEFQVVAIAHGVCTCVRLVDRSETRGVRTTMTEVVELNEAGAITSATLECSAENPRVTEWEWIAPARGEARLTGGFIVTRADGSQEFDRCPTETTKA